MKNYYDQVKNILTQYPVAQDDDMKLYAIFLYSNKCVDREERFYDVLTSAKKRKLPSYEGVTRARRKVQENEPSLRGKRYAARKKEEEEYKEFYGEP